MEEDTISLILEGCSLAIYLQSTLPILLKEPKLLLGPCDDIAKLFTLATLRIRNQNPNRPPHPQPVRMIDVDFRERPRFSPSSQSQKMDIRGLLQATYEEGGVRRLQRTGSGQVAGVEGREVHTMSEVSNSGKSVLSPRKSRGRKDNKKKQPLRVAAPNMGNTETPPDDGFMWTKYGQSEILGSKFPRSFYRCTHQKLYQCPAKKQVQRLDDDPSIFQVQYQGEHSCHRSATAPSVSPLPAFPVPHQPTSQALASHFPPSSSLPFRWGWPPVELSSGTGSTAAGGGEGPSIVGFGRETEFSPVADIADSMFNPYYRCTHQNLYQCPAKKQVQRLDDNPSTFQVTYQGEHSCHTSATAPSVSLPTPFPVPHQPTSQALASHFPPSSSPPFPWGWPPVELSSGSGSTASMAGGGEDPSTVQFDRETEFSPVADMAGAMFNSGTSTSDNLEFLFPSVARKEPGDSKK